MLYDFEKLIIYFVEFKEYSSKSGATGTARFFCNMTVVADNAVQIASRKHQIGWISDVGNTESD